MSDCTISDDTCAASEEEYLCAIQQNLPKGVIWSLEDDDRVISRFWRSIASGFAACSQFLCGVLDELFPCTATSMLFRWAASFGYPSDCPSPELTGQHLCEWIALQDSDCAGPTIGFLQEVAEWLGYPAASLSEWGAPISSVGCGQLGCMQLGASSAAPALQGYTQWLLIDIAANPDVASGDLGSAEMGGSDMSSGNCAPSATRKYAQLGSCEFQLGCTPVCAPDPPPIMCIISKFVPAHVGVRYREV